MCVCVVAGGEHLKVKFRVTAGGVGFGEKSGVGVRQGGEFNVRRAGRGRRERGLSFMG